MVVKKKTTSKSKKPELETVSPAPKRDEAELTEFSKKKRERMLAAAIECFLELGYEKASMNLVAERAGVIKQTIYSHFNDKEGLFVAAIASVTLLHIEEEFSPEALRTIPPLVLVRRAAETVIARHRDPIFCKLQRTIMSEASRFPALAALFTKATIKPGLAFWADYLRSHPDIDCPDPEASARVFIGTLVHYSIQQNLLHGAEFLPFDSARLVDELVRVFELTCLKRQ